MLERQREGRRTVEYKEAGLILHPLKCFIGITGQCHCYLCTNWEESTFSFAYFFAQGLTLGSAARRDFLRISRKLMSQVIVLTIKSRKTTERLFSLAEWSSFAVFKACPTGKVKETGLPAMLADPIDKVHPFLTDIITRDLAQEEGRSVFRPWSLVRFLFRHLGLNIFIDQLHYAREMQDVDWFRPPVPYRRRGLSRRVF